MVRSKIAGKLVLGEVITNSKVRKKRGLAISNLMFGVRGGG